MLRIKHKNVKNFFSAIEKELANGKTVTYKINSINSVRFIASSLLNLADNLVDGIHNSKCKVVNLAFNL